MKLENDTKSVENSQRGDDNPKTKGWHRMEKSKVDSKLPILGLLESLNFPVPRTVTWFPQTIKKTGKHDKKQVFREVLNPGVLWVFFPLFSSLDFVYCKIQR